MSQPALALLPSPLLGPAVWQPVAALLRVRGWDVRLPQPLRSGPSAPDEVLGWYRATLPANTPLVLVPHSNAGLFVPALVGSEQVVGVVFVDAGLPARAEAIPLAPPEFLERLSSLADAEGVLPPWTQWWPDDDVDLLFPDAATRAAVEAEQHRIPLAYLQSALVAPERWDLGLPGAYLAFGDTYADERIDASRRGWPTGLLDGQHLHMLVDPSAVAGEIERLVAELGSGTGRSGRRQVGKDSMWTEAPE